MSNLATTLVNRIVPPDCLAVYWLCQAGYAFKTSAGQIVYIDPYLSDVVERRIGFKRMMASPLAPEEVEADFVVCTHEHLDHMDTDALPVIARHARTHFAGPVECLKEFKRLGIEEGRCHLLEVGRSVMLGGTEIHAVFADHGELAPDAVGVILDFGGIKVYHTGDTAYRPKQFFPALEMEPDVLLPCINGAFGNMNAREAAQLTQLAEWIARGSRPLWRVRHAAARTRGRDDRGKTSGIPALPQRVVMPNHFWMFVEQNGDPASFLKYCSEMAPDTEAVITKPGEEYIIRKLPQEPQEGVNP